MTLLDWAVGEPSSDDPGESVSMVARAFGTSLDDLAVNFAAPIDVTLSALLCCCLFTRGGASFSGAEVASWTVPHRRQGLLAVAVATHGARRVITAECPRLECGARIDLDVDLAAFRRDWRPERIDLRLAGGEMVTLRQPTPADVASWSRSDRQGVEAMAASLVIGSVPLAEGWAEEAQAALSSADPLADMVLDALCPECGGEIAHSVELEPFLLGELAAEAGRLVDEIHVFAMAYHWTEPEIVALPEDRRRRYLSRIREAWAA
jgi:hypothetical protein